VALVRGADRAGAAGQRDLHQCTQAAGHPADQARQYPARGADRLPAPGDEIHRPGDPGAARGRQRPRAGGRVRADHAQPDLRLPGGGAGRTADPDRLDRGPGHELHHLRGRGGPGNHAVHPRGGPLMEAVTARPLQDRAVLLFIVLAAFFCANAVLAEFIGVKIFALEDTLGLAPLEWNLFGQTGSLSFTAGTLLWPIVFIMTDTINEFFGRRGVRFISWLAAGLICYGFLFAFVAISLAPASWWREAAAAQGVPDYQAAFAAVFGQGLWTIAGSLVAFVVGQLIDVAVFHRI